MDTTTVPARAPLHDRVDAVNAVEVNGAVRNPDASLPDTAPAWLRDESLPASGWARLLGVHRNNLYQPGVTAAGTGESKRRQRVGLYAFGALPEAYQRQLDEKRQRAGCAGFADLLALATRESVHNFGQLSAKTAVNRDKAQRWRAVLAVYYEALAKGGTKTECRARARRRYAQLFNRPGDDRNLRRKVKIIDDCGGFDLAPLVAFCDQKDVPHPRARLVIPPEFIAALRARAVRVGMEHLRAAFRSFEMDWQQGREVPGYGYVEPYCGEPLPVTFEQMRKFFPSTPARRLGGHGKARALRECLPNIQMTRVNLRRAERYVLDDTRVDIICEDDLTGQPVELKSYWMLDCGPRRIEGWVCGQSTLGGRGNIHADQVGALVARTLHNTGLCPSGTTIHFERGATACTAAAQSLLEGLFPGKLRISRTGMDGGRAHAAEFRQQASGHWMGKGEIESFMRTFAFFVQHVAGQRGGSYRRQPAQLGLTGRDAKTGFLAHTAGSQMAVSARHAYADRAAHWLASSLGKQAAEMELAALNGEGVAGSEGGCDPNTGQSPIGQRIAGGRLRLHCLKPRRWVEDAFKEFVAYYNNRSNHRMEGFADMEVHVPGEGLRTRRETPNERALTLETQCPPERISAADCSLLLTHRARTVTVGRNGVTISIGGLRGARFYHEDRLAIAAALRLATCKKEFVALCDEDAFAQHSPESLHPRQIYLLSDAPSRWKPGQAGRFLEALPLVDPGDLTDPASLAERTAKKERVVARYEAEVLRAAGPDLAQRLAEATEDESRLHSLVTVGLHAGRRDKKSGRLTKGNSKEGESVRGVEQAESALSRELRQARDSGGGGGVSIPEEEDGAPTRAGQQEDARERFAAWLAVEGNDAAAAS